MSEEDIFYMSVPEPGTVRRNVLETQKALLTNLRRVEEFSKAREAKLSVYSELNKVMREINLLTLKLRKGLPKTGIRAATSAKKKMNALPTPKKEVKKDNIDALQGALDNIEAQLGELLPR